MSVTKFSEGVYTFNHYQIYENPLVLEQAAINAMNCFNRSPYQDTEEMDLLADLINPDTMREVKPSQAENIIFGITFNTLISLINDLRNDNFIIYQNELTKVLDVYEVVFTISKNTSWFLGTKIGREPFALMMMTTTLFITEVQYIINKIIFGKFVGKFNTTDSYRRLISLMEDYRLKNPLISESIGNLINILEEISVKPARQ